jgi:hypothetical protein
MTANAVAAEQWHATVLHGRDQYVALDNLTLPPHVPPGRAAQPAYLPPTAKSGEEPTHPVARFQTLNQGFILPAITHHASLGGRRRLE